jgi:hypothetical protein
MPARRDSQLARAGEQNVAGFVPLPADQGVLAVGAEPPVGSGLASGTRQAVVAAGSAVLGLSAQLDSSGRGRRSVFCRVQQHLPERELSKDRSPTR